MSAFVDCDAKKRSFVIKSVNGTSRHYQVVAEY